MRYLLIVLCCIGLAQAEGYTFTSAQRLYKEKKYAEAAAVYSYIAMNRQAIRPYVQYRSADCLFQLKKYQEALALLERIEPDGRSQLQEDVQALRYACFDLLGKRLQLTPQQRLWYGEYLFRQNRFAESMDWLQTLPTETRNARYYYVFGRDHFSVGAWVSANRELQQAALPEADYYRALALLRGGYPQAAQQLLQLLGQGDSAYAPYALKQLADIAQVRGNLVLRNGYYRQIIHRFPSHILADDAAWILGWQLYSEKSYRQAQNIFLHGYTQHPYGDYSDALLFWAGKAAARQQNTDTAMVLWQKVAMQFPARYYGIRAAGLVSLNMRITEVPPLGGSVPDSIRQFLQEQAYREALSELEQISPNMRAADVAATRRMIATEANNAGEFTVAVRALYPLFLDAEKTGYTQITLQDWRLYFPRGFGRTVSGILEKYVRVPESLVYAVMREESLFDPEVVSAAGATGLMQLMPNTAQLLAVRQKKTWEPERLTHPETNIGYGILYLNNLLIRYNDRLPDSIAGYNAGTVAADKWSKRLTDDSDEWIETLTYRETRGYVKKVLRSLYWYKRLYAE